MLSIRRWSLVAAGVAVLVSLPYVVAHRPVGSSTVGAADLLQKVQQSGSVGYSGYAESVGGLALPVTSEISAVANLFGSRTQMRAWYRGAEDYRVDNVYVTGETDVYRDGVGMWTWEYERAVATRTRLTDAAVRLPETMDLLPTELARRLLSEALPSEATRLGSQRVAGIDAPGIEIHPDEPQSSIDRVDVWADPSTGLPLRVSAYGKGSSSSVMTTSFLDVSIKTPAQSTTRFTPPDSSHVQYDDGFDPLSGTNQFAPVAPPDALAGINRATTTQTPGAVGVYGRGVTQLVAVPLRRGLSRSLREQIENIATADKTAQSLTVGPLNLMVTTDKSGVNWLLVGTVTLDTLKKAGGELAARTSQRR